ncbi:TniQ family protein [Dankookia sp. GCM10030260]|uniref:TniQ family protein n=1 Tax=Dankookia sp. GCM10030260 TaxID=3273390 RepID=UPI003620E173
MPPLPVAPPPMPGEAFTSWLARLAARYDLAPEELAAAVGAPGPIGPLQDHAVPAALARTLASATGLAATEIAALGLSTALPALPTSWLRDQPAWCQACLAEATSHAGEVHRLALWSVGFFVVCPHHGMPLRTGADFGAWWSGAPCCARPGITFAAAHGRQRASCPSCGARHEHRAPDEDKPSSAGLGPATEFQALLLRAAAGVTATDGWNASLTPATTLAVAADVCALAAFHAELVPPRSGPPLPAPFRTAFVRSAPEDAWTSGRVPPHDALRLLETAAWLLDDAPDQGIGQGQAARQLRPRFRGLRVLRLSLPVAHLPQAERLAGQWPATLRTAFCQVDRD